MSLRRCHSGCIGVGIVLTVCVCMCACLCFVSCVWCSRQGLIGTLGGLKIKQGTFENVEVGICFDGAVCVQGQEGIGY